MEVYIDNRQPIQIDDKIEEIIKRVVKESLLVEGLGLDYEVSVSLVDNEEIQQLNREYRGVDRPTDVLSFPLEDEFGLLPILGDIVISIEKAKEQAEEFNHSLEREIAYLTAHSMLHLMGYDHMEEEEKKAMRSKEKEVMKRLGIFKNDKGRKDEEELNR
ncbi:MAG: rRNA maturation RNase YbeY [Tissierellia bacterium]|nr:rRNA maturation RNase YbeY [Tissierellia bacterium]